MTSIPAFTSYFLSTKLIIIGEKVAYIPNCLLQVAN